MSPAVIRRKVEEEIARVPDAILVRLYDLIHAFRLQAQKPSAAERIMSLAGSWSDMPESEYSSLMTEIEERRQRAGAGRRAHDAGSR